MKIAKPINEIDRLKEIYANRLILAKKIINVKISTAA